MQNTSTHSWRHERKFVLPGTSMSDVLARIHMHPAGFREAYPPRVVNNVYLDTHGLGDYHDHVAGATSRSKTRMRWYGPYANTTIRPSLERKIKQGAVGRKEVFALPLLSLNGDLDGLALDELWESAELSPSVRMRLELLQPTLINRYRRKYFENSDSTIRLTVDSEIESIRPNGNGFTAHSIAAPPIVLELTAVFTSMSRNGA